MQSLVHGRDYRSSLNSRSHKKVSGVPVTASDDFLFCFVLFCLEKINVSAILDRVMKDQY